MPGQCKALRSHVRHFPIRVLALGCHFSSWQGAFDDPQDLATAGNHFFKEAKRHPASRTDMSANAWTVQSFAFSCSSFSNTSRFASLFYRDYIGGVSSSYCSSLLVNAILALGCHFSSWQVPGQCKALRSHVRHFPIRAASPL
jgi:hypothetical protein